MHESYVDKFKVPYSQSSKGVLKEEEEERFITHVILFSDMITSSTINNCCNYCNLLRYKIFFEFLDGYEFLEMKTWNDMGELIFIQD